MAIWLLHAPLKTGLVSYGLGLVAIVLVEGRILARREHLPPLQAIWLATMANVCSLVIGSLMLLGLATLPYGIGWIPLLMVYGLLSLFSTRLFAPAADARPVSALKHVLRVATWSLHWLYLLVSSLVLLAGGISQLNPTTVAGSSFPDPAVPIYVNAIQLGAVMVFLGIGFVTCVVTEGYCLSRLLPGRSRTMMRTVLIMNLRSYTYIAVPITVLFLLRK